ncbi:PREDICTED: kinesin-like protein KIF27 isoform X1 [Poecilia mexicana]|uniref:Kinesin motor domain-containing protein n=1 Tax=Poecilia mexicana TaxID=48701 RepID=A0A3B3YBJ9_9TELE|nr:PREDICTED: kinesin-like protein KIF27 isoform X1 [Poecilia mexicana]
MSEVCVRVAVRIRPLLRKELLHQHQVCVQVVPSGSGQVRLGSDRLFSFDHAFGPTASQDEVYESCVQPLVESLLDGYNATVFCYGQTGSGKTYTLGGGSKDEGGIIDCVAEDVFLLLAKRKNDDSIEATVQISYMELYREELRDLLDMNTNHKELLIRDDEKGNTVVIGAREMVVTSAEELLGAVEMGNALRHTGATGMNEHSSRSHVILTLQVRIRSHSNNNPPLKTVRSSKLCLVDLAGSERASKTGNTGAQFKESALINTGLLALGNVIRALSDRGRSRRGNGCSSPHVPYRDAKITRLLRDSLGGNAHTVMVACVSPSHHFIAETLNVLQFASKARHICNCPGRALSLTDVKSDPKTCQPAETRLEELVYEVQTLRELLKEKEKDMKEMEREKTRGGGGDGDGFKQPSQITASTLDKRPNQDTAAQYLFLAKEAASLLADMSKAFPSVLFRQRLQEWQERLAGVSQSHHTGSTDCSEGAGDHQLHVTNLNLREELRKCQEALQEKKQLLEEKDEELRRIRREVEKLLDEKRNQVLATEEEKERSRIQTEQLVSQQVLIDRLRSSLVAVRGMTPGATEEARPSGNSCTRPQSVPLITHSLLHRPSRKIHSSPPTCSLERVMTAFRRRGHLLLAEIEEKDKVYCPFITQQAESKERTQNNHEEETKEEETEMERSSCRTEFRLPLNRTWTSWEKRLLLKPKSTRLEMYDGNTAVPESCLVKEAVSFSNLSDINENAVKKVRRTNTAERRIHELKVSMRLKEELIKELDTTERKIQAVDRGETGSVLERLSMQSQQVRAEIYRSLQSMRLERARLQSSLRELDETNSRKPHRNRGLKSSSVPENSPVETNRMLHDSSWLEEEEERAIHQRAELQELGEELKRKVEVLQHREACVQQKNKLHIKMLQSSQALSRDLLQVSVQLESVEEQLQSQSSVRKTRGVTVRELEKERDMLKMKRDTLEAQLRDNRVLTVEEEHSLLQLEEAVEALDAALEFKNNSIQERQKHLFVGNSPLLESKDTEPAQHCDVTRKLKKLSLPEAIELLIKYFNKVVCLREAERRLHLQCEELELHAGEQEAALREMEAAMQRFALDADRRLTLQHREHQSNVRLLLQKLKEGMSGEAQQAIQDRVQHLEKELFFYKSSSRQLKKKLKELLSDAPYNDNQSSHTQESRERQGPHLLLSADEPKTHCEEEGETTHVSTTYTKIYAEEIESKPVKPSLTQSHGRYTRGQPEASLEMTPVKLCRRELREIPAADLQLLGAATRRHQSVVNSSSESMMEDSIEVPRNT